METDGSLGKKEEQASVVKKIAAVVLCCVIMINGVLDVYGQGFGGSGVGSFGAGREEVGGIFGKWGAVVLEEEVRRGAGGIKGLGLIRDEEGREEKKSYKEEEGERLEAKRSYIAGKSAAQGERDGGERYAREVMKRVVKRGKDGSWEYEGGYCEGDGGGCYYTWDYMQGMLEGIVWYARGEREIMAGKVGIIGEIVEEFGVSEEMEYGDRRDEGNRKRVREYMREVVKGADDSCDNDFYMVNIMPGLGRGRAVAAREGARRKERECVAVSEAMVLLGALGREREAGGDAELLYIAGKKTWDRDYGIIALPGAIGGLVALGSQEAYGKIKRLLMEDTVKGRWYKPAVEILDLMSVGEWAKKGINRVNYIRGGGGAYLNEGGSRYQYIDEGTSKEYGISENALVQLKDGRSGEVAWNVAYGNVLEDIGEMLSSEEYGKGSKARSELRNEIIKRYNEIESQREECVKGRAIAKYVAVLAPAAAVLAAGLVRESGCSAGLRMHIPLVAGILKNGNINTLEAKLARERINKQDWWDLNEGTQRRVNNIVAKGGEGLKERGYDEAKAKRNERDEKVINAGAWADIGVTAGFAMGLVYSLPGILRSGVNFVSRVYRIGKVSGKRHSWKLLRSVRRENKKSGITKRAIEEKKVELSKKRVERAIRVEASRKEAIEKAREALKEELRALQGGMEVGGSEIKAVKIDGANGKVVAEAESGSVEFGLLEKGKRVEGMEQVELTAQAGEGSGGGVGVKLGVIEAKPPGEVVSRAQARGQIEILRQGAVPVRVGPRKLGKIGMAKLRIGLALDILKGGGWGIGVLAKSPNKVFMAGVLPFGTTAQLARPIAPIVQIGKSGHQIARVSEVNNAPKIVGVLNEPQAFGHQLKTIAKTARFNRNYKTLTINNTAAAIYTPLRMKFNPNAIYSVNADSHLEIKRGGKIKTIRSFTITAQGNAAPNLLAAIFKQNVLNEKKDIKLFLKLNDKTERRFDVKNILREDGSLTYAKLAIPASLAKELKAEGEYEVLVSDGKLIAKYSDGKRTEINVAALEAVGKYAKAIEEAVKSSGGRAVNFQFNSLQGNRLRLILSFLPAISISAYMPAFGETFGQYVGDIWIKNAIAFMSFAPTAMLLFIPTIADKFGLVKTIKSSGILYPAGILFATLSGALAVTLGPSALSLAGAAIGIFTAAISNEIKLSTMDAIAKANNENKQISSLIILMMSMRSLSTFALCMFPMIYSQFGISIFGLSNLNSSLAVAVLALPFAIAGALSILPAKLRDMPQYNAAKSIKDTLNMWKGFFKDKRVIRTSLAFLMSESFELTMTYLVYDMSLRKYGDSVAAIAQGAVVYLAMFLGRIVFSNLNRAGVLNNKSSFITMGTASLLGAGGFALLGPSAQGLVLAAIAVACNSMSYPLLSSAAMRYNSGKETEVAGFIFTLSFFAFLSGPLYGRVKAVAPQAVSWVPIAIMATLLLIGKIVLENYKPPRAMQKFFDKFKSAKPQSVNEVKH
jgi:hypothetical protein